MLLSGKHQWGDSAEVPRILKNMGVCLISMLQTTGFGSGLFELILLWKSSSDPTQNLNCLLYKSHLKCLMASCSQQPVIDLTKHESTQTMFILSAIVCYVVRVAFSFSLCSFCLQCSRMKSCPFHHLSNFTSFLFSQIR